MRVIETTVYTYDELSEEAQLNAIDYNINVDHEWWDYLYDDMASLGIKVTSFDDHQATIELIEFPLDIAANIMGEWGEKTELYKTALSFKNDWEKLHHSSVDADTEEDLEEDLEEEFTKALAEDIRIMLNKEYEYLTSEELVIETIRDNEYEFTEDGILI